MEISRNLRSGKGQGGQILLSGRRGKKDEVPCHPAMAKPPMGLLQQIRKQLNTTQYHHAWYAKFVLLFCTLYASPSICNLWIVLADNASLLLYVLQLILQRSLSVSAYLEIEASSFQERSALCVHWRPDFWFNVCLCQSVGMKSQLLFHFSPYQSHRKS